MALQRQLAVAESVPVIARLRAVAPRQRYLADNTILESAPLLGVQVPVIDKVDSAERLRWPKRSACDLVECAATMAANP
jgi:hypothetical protein